MRAKSRFGVAALGALIALGAGCSAEGVEDNAGFSSVGSPTDGGDGGSAGSGGQDTGGSGGQDTGGSGGQDTGGSGGQDTGGSGGQDTGGSGGQDTGGSGGQDTGGSGGQDTGGSGGTTGGTGGSSGTGGGTGGSSGTGGTGGSSGSSGASCMDADTEPNDTDETPQTLDSIGDCDGDGDTAEGTLEGGSDKDWFTFHADDNIGCSVNPTFVLYSSDSALLCAYFICDGGGDEITCPSGSSEDTSPGGLSGCCTTTGSLEPGINCSGLDDASQVYIMVHAPSNTGCQSYSVDYHY